MKVFAYPFVAIIVWVAVEILAVPAGHSFGDRLLQFGWFLVMALYLLGFFAHEKRRHG